MKHPPWITLAVIAYGVWASRGVAAVWWNSPLEHFSWLPLLLWLLPARDWSEEFTPGQAKGIAAALACLLLGFLASLNSFKQAGLAIAIVSLVPWSCHSALWAFLAISWMPGLGWVIAHVHPSTGACATFAVRIVLALLGVSVMWRRNHGHRH